MTSSTILRKASHRRFICKAVVASTALLGLSACSHLQKTIEDQVAQSQYCAVVKDIQYRDDWQPPKDFLTARLGELRTEEACEIHGGKSTSRFLPICRLSDIAQKHKQNFDTLESTGKTKLSDLETAFTATSKELGNLGKAIKSVDCKTVSTSTERPEALVLAQAGDLSACWLKVMESEKSAVELLLRSLATTQSVLEALVRDLSVVGTQNQQLKIDLTIWQHATQSSLTRFVATLRDSEAAMQDMARGYVPNYSARLAVDAVHRALRPVDRGLERADERGYGAVSLSLFAANKDLKSLLASPIETHVFKRMESLDKTDSRCDTRNSKQHCVSWSFALAATQRACERADNDQDASLLSGVVNAAIIQAANTTLGVSRSEDIAEAVLNRQISNLGADRALADRDILGRKGQNSILIAAALAKHRQQTEVSRRHQQNLRQSLSMIGIPDAGSPSPPASVFARYVEREWDARALIVQKRIQAALAQGTDLQRVLVQQAQLPLDEALVRELATASLAPQVDQQWRASAHPGHADALNGTEQASQPKSSSAATAEQLSKSAADIPPLKTLFAEAASYHSATLTVNVGLQPPDFCAEPALGDLRGHCAVIGSGFSVRLRPAFPTQDWDATALPDLRSEVTSLASALDQFSARSNAQLRIRVTGGASTAEANNLCIVNRSKANRLHQEGKSDVLTEKSFSLDKNLQFLEYQSMQNRLFRIDACGQLQGRDAGNQLLGALRAASVAALLERGSKTIVLEEVASTGSRMAPQSAIERDRAADRAVLVEISPSYLAPTRPDNLAAQ